MLYLETINLPGDVNMALDVTLGEYSFNLGEPILRIYSWERPTVSLGRHQREDDLDWNEMRKLDVDCVRRPTGGRAVLHWGEVTYSVVFPRGREEYELGVLDLYKRISGILIGGLKRIEPRLEISDGKEWNFKNPSCFSSSSRYEITLGGKKVVGSAQARFEKFVLQHGSIILKPRWDLLSRILALHPTDLHEKATGLNADFRSVADAIAAGFDEVYCLKRMDFSEALKIIRSAESRRGDFACRNST